MTGSKRPLAGRFILIIEDEPFIALEVQAAFVAVGARTASATGIRKAIQMIGNGDLSAAVVDISLGSDDCSAVCKRLSEGAIPFVFYTGHVRAGVLMKWPEAPVLTKLADKGRVVEVVAGVLR
jgi:CheY-like chemotaxis protein